MVSSSSLNMKTLGNTIPALLLLLINQNLELRESSRYHSQELCKGGSLGFVLPEFPGGSRAEATSSLSAKVFNHALSGFHLTESLPSSELNVP